uniref:AT3G52170-like helix-turn-helix domain-containing protein n=1 Tax=Aegilops tauschii subsp. strangulata TaxID=200361 RepID=A0A453CGK5_AEGTS
MHASARFSSSFASSRKAISDAVARSSYRPLCGKKHLGSLSAQDPPKVQKRLTKEERRAKVEEFVENYRASHEGKFPSATYVRKQVGGSYYVSWALLQELEYNSRLRSDVRDASFNSTRDVGTSFEGIKEETVFYCRKPTLTLCPFCPCC